MNNQKIAILTDSGTNLPKEYQEKENIFVVPLKIIFKDQQFLDGVEMSPEELLERLTTEIPKTSLPDGQMIYDTLTEIQEKGYTHVIAFTISSQLSGTFNALRLAVEDFPALTVALIDTKNIDIAAGFQGIYAQKLIEKELSFETIVKKINQSIPKTKVFFSIATLEYLQKGGRIGLVTSVVGNLLSLKPVISCNEEGVYYTVAKTRGLQKSREHLKKLIEKEVPADGDFVLAVAYAGVKEDAKKYLEWAQAEYPGHEVIFTPLSAALSVHTGAGLIGMGIQPY